MDSYDVSLIGASSAQNKAIARQWCAENNPNDLSVDGKWFDDLPLHKRRWVPYNGGVSDEQLAWLSAVLQIAKDAGEEVVVFSHQPVHSPSKPQSLVWNAEQVLSVLHAAGNVRMWIAGHDHDGQCE